MDKTENIKKLLCYNIVNFQKCLYKNKCMFAHSLDDQKKDTLRQYIYDIIYLMDDLSNINIYNDKNLLDELIVYTKECKNCINKKCPGGYNCKFGACTKEIKICYNDMMYGKCFNILKEEDNNDFIIKRCIHGIHLTEKNLIPFYLRVPVDFNCGDFTSLKNYNINFNSKNNIISLLLNNETIHLVKDLLSNKNNKLDIINNFKNNKLNIINNENNNLIINENNNNLIINENTDILIINENTDILIINENNNNLIINENNNNLIINENTDIF